MSSPKALMRVCASSILCAAVYLPTSAAGQPAQRGPAAGASPHARVAPVTRRPAARTPARPVSTDGAAVVREALKWVGVPRYRMGGTQLEKAIDASHFVEAVFKRVKQPVPDTPVRNQMNHGRIVHARGGPAEDHGRVVTMAASPSLDVLRPGDRLIFQSDPRKMGRAGSYHTGIYVGQYKGVEHAVVHCNATDKTVSVTELTSSRLWRIYRYAVRGAERRRALR